MAMLDSMTATLDEFPSWERTGIDERLLRVQVEHMFGVIGEVRLRLYQGAAPFIFRKSILKAERTIVAAWLELSGAAHGRRRFAELIGSGAP